MGSGDEQFTPLLGRDISWDKVNGAILHVISFGPLARVVDGKVKRVVKEMPYASIKVRAIELSTPALLFVTHKIDFLNLWEVFKVRKVKANEEVNVIWTNRNYKKFTLLKFAQPKLVIWINHKGAWRLIHGLDKNKLTGSAAYFAEAPIVEFKPEIME